MTFTIPEGYKPREWMDAEKVVTGTGRVYQVYTGNPCEFWYGDRRLAYGRSDYSAMTPRFSDADHFVAQSPYHGPVQMIRKVKAWPRPTTPNSSTRLETCAAWREVRNEFD